MSNVAGLIEHALSNFESVNAIIGAIMLTESIFNVLDKNRMEQAAERLNSHLKKISDYYVNIFKLAQNELKNVLAQSP
jgi:hypothetical protein